MVFLLFFIKFKLKAYCQKVRQLVGLEAPKPFKGKERTFKYNYEIKKNHFYAKNTQTLNNAIFTIHQNNSTSHSF